MSLSKLSCLAAATAIFATLSPQTEAAPVQTSTWSELMPLSSPPGTAGGDIVTDGTRALAFGGKEQGAGLQNKVWSFDGTDWFDISPTTGSTPLGRKTGGVVWDSGRDRLVVFGGQTTASTSSNDTWEWDGSAWAEIITANTPSALKQCEMVYVPGLGKTYLFGGFDGSALNNETWEYDGTNWTQLFPVNNPPARRQHQMAVDTANNRVVMFGGMSTPSGSMLTHNDTWVFDGTNWTEIVTTSFPTNSGTYGLNNAAMCYDPLRDRVVLFGGVETGPTLAATWEFDGTDWASQGISGPGDRSASSQIYVPAFGRIILFGGYRTTQMDDTWEHKGPTTGIHFCFGDGSGTGCPCANESTLGAGEGCQNSQGHGARLSASGEAAIGANALAFTISQARPGQPSMLVQGSASTSIPFKDGILCMGNPTERVEVVFLDANGGGQTVSDIAIGGNVTVPSSTRYYQAWYRDPSLSVCGSGSNFTQGIELTWI